MAASRRSFSGVGGKFFYGPGKNDRESDDGVFVTFEESAAGTETTIQIPRDSGGMTLPRYSSG